MISRALSSGRWSLALLTRSRYSATTGGSSYSSDMRKNPVPPAQMYAVELENNATKSYATLQVMIAFSIFAGVFTANHWLVSPSKNISQFPRNWPWQVDEGSQTKPDISILELPSEVVPVASSALPVVVVPK